MLLLGRERAERINILQWWVGVFKPKPLELGVWEGKPDLRDLYDTGVFFLLPLLPTHTSMSIKSIVMTKVYIFLCMCVGT